MTARVKASLKYFLTIFFALLVLGLSGFCLRLYAAKQSVLGAQTEIKTPEIERAFWGNLLNENPNYLPGWLEVGRLDKVYEINPNFIP